MKTSYDFIIDRLKQLIEKFPHLIFKYVYDKRENCHIIEVEPLTEFKSNVAYMEAESDLVFEFDNLYLPDSILFVSEESLTRVLNPDIIIKTTI